MANMIPKQAVPWNSCIAAWSMPMDKNVISLIWVNVAALLRSELPTRPYYAKRPLEVKEQNVNQSFDP